MNFYNFYIGCVIFCTTAMHLYNNLSKENINNNKEGISYLEFFKGGLFGILLILAPGLNLIAGLSYLYSYIKNSNQTFSEPQQIKPEYKSNIEQIKLDPPIKVKKLTLEEARMEAQRLYGTYDVHKGLPAPVQKHVLELTRKPKYNNKSDN